MCDLLYTYKDRAIRPTQLASLTCKHPHSMSEEGMTHVVLSYLRKR